MEERHTIPLDAMDPRSYRRLERQAAEHKRSVEDEAIAIIASAVDARYPVKDSAGEAFDELLKDWEGVDIPIPPRTGSTAGRVDFSE